MTSLSKILSSYHVQFTLHEVKSMSQMHKILDYCKYEEWYHFLVDLSLPMTLDFMDVVSQRLRFSYISSELRSRSLVIHVNSIIVFFIVCLQALMEGLIRVNRSFMLMNMDAQLLDLSPYQYNDANITTLTLYANTTQNSLRLRDMAIASRQSNSRLLGQSNKLTVRPLVPSHLSLLS